MSTQPSPQDLQTILEVNGYEPIEVKFFHVTEIVPDSLDWIFDEGVWDDCPFSMGDSVYTLISAITTKQWINGFIESGRDLTKKERKDLNKLNELLNLCEDAQVYIMSNNNHQCFHRQGRIIQCPCPTRIL